MWSQQVNGDCPRKWDGVLVTYRVVVLKLMPAVCADKSGSCRPNQCWQMFISASGECAHLRSSNSMHMVRATGLLLCCSVTSRVIVPNINYYLHSTAHKVHMSGAHVG